MAGEIDLVLDHLFGRGLGVNRRLGLTRALRALSVYVYPIPSLDEIAKTISVMKEIDLCLDASGLRQEIKLAGFKVKDDWVGCDIKQIKGEEVDQASIDEVLSLVVRIAFAKHLQSMDVSNPVDKRMFC